MKPKSLLGTPEGANNLLTDLYVRLRDDLKEWAAITHQTPQPRMGYIGQHLVSVITGYPGGRSGARGDDLKLPDGRVAEIKCCYRVDQLGKCLVCKAAVAGVEDVCPACGSDHIKRNDDSKWLIPVRSERELEELFVPAAYYLVLFEFEDLKTSRDINVKVFTVNPHSPGFALCMIDYFFNIRSKSQSQAPFNLWPNSPKFAMMKPELIYYSIIAASGEIRTLIFPGRNEPVLQPIPNLVEYVSARTITDTAIDRFASRRGVHIPKSGLPRSQRELRKKKLEILQDLRIQRQWDDREVADDLARAVFYHVAADYPPWVNRFVPA